MFGRKTTTGKRGEPLPENHEGPPDSTNPAGLCPRCEKQSSFDYVGSLPLTFDGGYILGRGDEGNTPTFTERSTVLICRNCHQGVAVLEEQVIGGKRAGERRSGTITWKGFHWWPLVGSTVHKAVPTEIADTFHEAVLALSANCPRAAAVMARRTLEAIAVDQGETSGTLAQRLSKMSSRGLLHQTLADWAKEVRLVGNVGAHFDPMQTVAHEDARQLIDFIRELAKFIYVLPFELKERRRSTP